MTFKLYFTFFTLSLSLHLFLFINWDKLNNEVANEINSNISAGKISVLLKNSVPLYKKVAKSKSHLQQVKKIIPPNEEVGSELQKIETEIKPIYPYLSRLHNEQGLCTLEVSVSKSGEVISVTIIKSTGHHRLDQEAIRVLKAAHFTASPNKTSDINKLSISIDFQL